MEELEAKLSYSGRISLTDIVKATINNDHELPQSPKNKITSDEDLSETEPEARTQEIPNNGFISFKPFKDFAFQKNESCAIQPHGRKRIYSECDIDNTCVNQSKKFRNEILNQSQQSLSTDENMQSLTCSRLDDIVNQSAHAADRKFNFYQVAEQSSNSSINCRPAMDGRLNDSLSLLTSPDHPFSQNPLFAALQAILAVECKKNSFPHTLLAAISVEKREEDVFTREQNLQHRFDNLKDKCPDEIQQLSSFYQYHLHEKQFPPSCKDYLNAHYDLQLHMLHDRVEKSMTLLEKTQMENDAINNRTTRHFKPRPLLPKHATKIMEDWYSQNSEHPYPNPIQAAAIAEAGNIGVEQVKKWMANKRKRTCNTRTLTEIAMRKRQLSTEDKPLTDTE
ncbi:hypothetical protein ACJMK2_020261 [Sinanodonta woodiana]|uniref:Homeobox domain-containing protein n=1 Tax=Sinanodonta woodiana TaxID=1069815 RepID=A0ABD3TYQ2_SINWO